MEKAKSGKKIDTTTKDAEYKKGLDAQINSILDGKESISVEDLRKNSLFGNLSEKALQRLDYIAGIDGDKTSLTADEMRVLMSLTDSTLKDNTFVFDGKFHFDENSGLEQATDSEMQAVVTNLVDANTRKRLETLDTSKYDRSKNFADKITSDDVDEAMLALQDKLNTGFVDKRTGKEVSITQAVMQFEDFVNDSYRKNYQNFYVDVARDFGEQTTIPVYDFSRLRCMGDGDSFVIGDWTYQQGKLTNNKTGESLQVSRANWYNSAENTVPAADGSICIIREYNDGKGTVVKYNYDDSENAAPTSANITVNGKEQVVNYERKTSIDPELYNFIER